MKMLVRGYERVVPKSGKEPFIMLHGSYAKPGVIGEIVESIYVANTFTLPTLTPGMTIDVDRDGKGYLLAIVEAEPQTVKLNINKPPA